MTERKQSKAVRRTKQSFRKGPAGPRAIKNRPTQIDDREVHERLQHLEAKVIALTLALQHVTLCVLNDSENPVSELQRHRQKALQTIGYIDSLEEAMWVEELMQFYDAVISCFPKKAG